MGTGDYKKIAQVLKRIEKEEVINKVPKIPEFITDELKPRYIDNKKFVVYLRIAESCDYDCTICIIPKLGGLNEVE